MPLLSTLLLAIVLLLGCTASQVCACYAVIVGRAASADGSVLVGHNEENAGDRVLWFRKVPRQQHAPGSVVSLERGGQLEEVPETWAILWSENPGLEFSDGYLNEWGVAVASDACATREDDYDTLVARGEIRDGGIGYMLRRLVALRAKTAREGVDLVGRLVEGFGYVHSGRTYVIADPREAWLVAVVRGRHWVAQRVPDDRVVILPNVHVIGEVDLADRKNFLGSADLIGYAVQRGWFHPNSGKPFSFREVYQTADRLGPDPRQFRGQEVVTGKAGAWPPAEPLPFAVTPGRKLTVADVAAVLRDNTGIVPLFQNSTQEAAVFQLRADMPPDIGCVYWRTTGRPDTSVLTPWYVGITETPPMYDRLAEAAVQLSLEHHFQPPAGTLDRDPRMAWWKFKALQELADQDYANRIQTIRSAWSALEERAYRDQPSVEAKALSRWKEDPAAVRASLTHHCAELATEARAQADKLSAAFQAR